MIRRLLQCIPALFGVVCVVFIMTHAIGNPIAALLPPEASEEQYHQLEEALGFDKPLGQQFIGYWRNALRGDFGSSYWLNQPALGIVLQRLPATIELALAALLIAIVLGIPAGICAAVKRNSVVSTAVSVVSVLGMSMPDFWLGMILILWFGVSLRWLPISGRGGVEHLVLPACALGIRMMAILARLMRADMLDVLSQDYVRTAWAKGLRRSVVVSKHAVRNALIPTITMIGLQFGALIGGAVVVESVFGWPGAGRLLLQAIERRDYPLIQAAALVLAIAFLAINLLVDLVYGFVDPRIRYE
ncbi:MAG: ABC transporter permease [Candidatus Bipolaricaulis sp.]|nr:ABC transporter permease [Candidatus Bipolaricaulis sp.]